MSYQYIGEPGRYYPFLGVTVNPGDELETRPVDDGRWVQRGQSTQDSPVPLPPVSASPASPAVPVTPADNAAGAPEEKK